MHIIISFLFICGVVQVLDELKQRELRNSEKEEKIQVKKKTIDLLPDADNNLLKLQVGADAWCHPAKQVSQIHYIYVPSSLQALVEASAKRVVNLASQWEKHRAPLVDEYRRLKDICSSKDVCRVTGLLLFFNNKCTVWSFLCIFRRWNHPRSCPKSSLCMKRSVFLQRRPRRRKMHTNSWYWRY